MLPLIVEQESEAARRLPEYVATYFGCGSWDETSLAEAVPAWERLRFAPRILRDVATVDTSVTLFGSALSGPILAAPSAFHCLAHPRAEAETAEGLARARSLMVVSTRSTTPFETVTASGCPWWFQVYVLGDRGLTASLAKRAADSGAGALVLTADTPLVGLKRRSPGQAPVDNERFLAQFAPHLPEMTSPDATVYQSPSVTTADIAWLAELSDLPVLVKGVLRPDDALACLDAGASGVIVSNHGGRQLDRALPTADALGPVVAAVDGRAVVLVDGGLRDGLSILAALALGADAVLIGRPILWALAANGAGGVADLVDGLRGDLASAMALAGATSIDELDDSLIARR